jgi:hypothetical protein
MFKTQVMAKGFETTISELVELGEFDLEFCPRQAIKSQILTDFVSECTETQQSLPVEKPKHWKMYFDCSLNLEGAGAGVLFISGRSPEIRPTDPLQGVQQ